VKILAGSAHPELAKKIARKLKTNLGKIEISQFPDGEKRIHIVEKIESEIVFIIQPTIKDEDIIELCLIADAAKQMRAKKIVAVIPWFSYSAQDEVFRQGEPFSAKTIAKIIEASGIDEVLIVEPHSLKLENFFSIPATLISAAKIFSSFFRKRDLDDWIVAALDLGAVERSLRFAKELNLPLIFLQKTPRDRQTGKIGFLKIKGEIAGKNVLVFDDFVSTGQTLIKATKFLKQRKAKKVVACVTHYLSVKGLPERLEKSQIDKIFVSDSLPIEQKRKLAKLNIISLGPLLAKKIKNVETGF